MQQPFQNGTMDSLPQNKLQLVYAPKQVEPFQKFHLMFNLEHVHQDPGEIISVSRKTTYTTAQGGMRMVPLTGSLTASEDEYHLFQFDELMFYNPDVGESMGQVWRLEFLLQSFGHGVLSRLVVPIKVG
jgi:hypothetical protein